MAIDPAAPPATDPRAAAVGELADLRRRVEQLERRGQGLQRRTDYVAEVTTAGGGGSAVGPPEITLVIPERGAFIGLLATVSMIHGAAGTAYVDLMRDGVEIWALAALTISGSVIDPGVRRPLTTAPGSQVMYGPGAFITHPSPEPAGEHTYSLRYRGDGPSSSFEHRRLAGIVYA